MNEMVFSDGYIDVDLCSLREGLDKMIAGAKKSDQYDYYTPNMSLPHLIGMPADGTPPPLPRLAIPQDSQERAAKIVKPFADRFKICCHARSVAELIACVHVNGDHRARCFDGHPATRG